MIKKEPKKKKKLKKSVKFFTLSIIEIIISIICYIKFITMNILPIKILLLILIIFLVIDGTVFILLNKKNYKTRMIGTLLSIILIIVMSIVIKYQDATQTFLKNIEFVGVKTLTYKVVVLNDSDIESIDEVTKLGYLVNEDGLDDALSKLKESKDYYTKTCNGLTTCKKLLQDDEVDALLILKEMDELYKSEGSSIYNNTKSIYEFSIDISEDKITKSKDVSKEPITIYISGIDTFGKVSEVSRSDVNMLVTINPVTKNILITSIPRDYYVDIYGDDSDLKDKLTHAGIYGVDTSIKTIENLLNIEINYFARVNFTSVVSIVDALDGIDVESEYAFTAKYASEEENVYFEFPKGFNHLTGEQALAYARERYSLKGGDNARVKHEQDVMKAIINKLTSSKIVTKYKDLLESLNGKFVTDLGSGEINKIIELESTIPTWTIETQTLNGFDDSEKTSLMPDLYSYVMTPDEKSITDAKNKINEILKVE